MKTKKSVFAAIILAPFAIVVGLTPLITSFNVIAGIIPIERNWVHFVLYVLILLLIATIFGIL